MCFSATASFTAGTVLFAIGCLAARRARTGGELPYALIPALFGIQQWLEGALWLTLGKSDQCSIWLTQIYSGFSQVIWPIYIPTAVLLLEPRKGRRKALLGVTLAGAAVSLFLLYSLSHLQVQSQVIGQHISYVFPHFHEMAATGLYLLGACIGPLISSHRMVRLFGVAVTVALIVTYAFYSQWFISVWCFFAAVASVLVLAYFTRWSSDRRPGQAAQSDQSL
jgi:hypothetical protein